MADKKWKLIDILNLSTGYLAEKQVDNPRLNAELLIGHILNKNRVQLYLNFEQPLTSQEVDRIRLYLKRRAQHEPIQYITGETEFYSLKFNVNHNTLIPRPETEILVEKIIEICNIKFPRQNKITMLDVGTGCGNIPICIAKYIKNAFIISIDIMPEILKVASENAKKHDVLNQIQFKKVNLFDVNLPGELVENFDIIVSNPPYISQDEMNDLPIEVKSFEPQIALYGGEDELSFYHRILQISHSILKVNGIIGFEMSYGKASQLKKLVRDHGFKDIKIINDLNKIERVIIAKR